MRVIFHIDFPINSVIYSSFDIIIRFGETSTGIKGWLYFQREKGITVLFKNPDFDDLWLKLKKDIEAK